MSYSYSEPPACPTTAAELKLYQTFIFSVTIFFTFIFSTVVLFVLPATTDGGLVVSAEEDLWSLHCWHFYIVRVGSEERIQRNSSSSCIWTQLLDQRDIMSRLPRRLPG